MKSGVFRDFRQESLHPRVIADIRKLPPKTVAAAFAAGTGWHLIQGLR